VALDKKAPVLTQVRFANRTTLELLYTSVLPQLLHEWRGRSRSVQSPLMTLMLLAKGVPKAAFSSRLASLLRGTCPEHSHRVPWRGTQAPHTSSAPALRVLAKMQGAPKPCVQNIS